MDLDGTSRRTGALGRAIWALVDADKEVALALCHTSKVGREREEVNGRSLAGPYDWAEDQGTYGVGGDSAVV